MWYIEQRYNPNKVTGMPDNYPWIVSDTFIENGIEISANDLTALQASFNAGALIKEELYDVTPRQMRQALILSGLTLSIIDAAIASLPEPNKSLAQVEWEYSVMFKRSNPLVNMIGYVVGKTPTEVDDLWRLASTL
jgi:hypothetical protein